MSKKGNTNNNSVAVKGGKGKQANDGLTVDQMLAMIEGNAETSAAAVAFQKKIRDEQARLRQRQHEYIQQQQAMLIKEAEQANTEVALGEEAKEWQSAGEGKWVRFAQFDGSDEQVQFIIALYDKELTEPYSTFTYEFFIFGWKDLCILAFGKESAAKPAATEKGEMIGAVVSRVTRKTIARPWRGYIAMLAVLPVFRGGKIGSKLVTITSEIMQKKGCEQVSLETPLTNARALKLYTDLGFSKVKSLPVYYLDGSDAVRLKLYLQPLDQASLIPDQPAVEAAAATTEAA